MWLTVIHSSLDFVVPELQHANTLLICCSMTWESLGGVPQLEIALQSSKHE